MPEQLPQATMAGTDTTRERLLAAAERILVEDGAHALTVRRIGQVSGLNGTLVTYHFGTMGALMQQLARSNLDPMTEAWEGLTGMADDLDRLLAAWLRPLLAPAAYNPSGRALLVLDELASHAEPGVRMQVMGAMVAVAVTMAQQVARLAPHLSPDTVMERLRFIAGAALGPPPRGHAATTPSLEGLIAFALAALRG
jgi:AcrR family transcriptional regulator